MSETVKAALIGATGAAVASLMAATAQIIVAYINKRSNKPKPEPSASQDQHHNNEGRKMQGVGVSIFLGVIMILLLAVGIFGFLKLNDEIKNGVLVAAATIIAALILQQKERKDMKKLKSILL